MSCSVATLDYNTIWMSLVPRPPILCHFYVSEKLGEGGQSLYISSFLQSPKSLESELAQCEEQKKVFLTKGN